MMKDSFYSSHFHIVANHMVITIFTEIVHAYVTLVQLNIMPNSVVASVLSLPLLNLDIL